MILFQDTDPIFTVLVLRFVICGLAIAGLAWVVLFVARDFKEWFLTAKTAPSEEPKTYKSESKYLQDDNPFKGKR